jgi:DNA-binding HxlR family transcriptional regulator
VRQARCALVVCLPALLYLTEVVGGFQELQLVSRTVMDASPVRVEYALTDRGEAMRPAITELTRWAEQNLSPSA